MVPSAEHTRILCMGYAGRTRRTTACPRLCADAVVVSTAAQGMHGAHSRGPLLVSQMADMPAPIYYQEAGFVRHDIDPKSYLTRAHAALTPCSNTTSPRPCAGWCFHGRCATQPRAANTRACATGGAAFLPHLFSLQHANRFF